MTGSADIYAVGIEVSPEGARAGSRQIASEMDRIGGAAKRAQKDTTDSFDRMSRNINRAFAAIGITALMRELQQMADVWAMTEGRLRLVTGSMHELAAVQASLFQVAQQTRSGYADTVDLYARMARGAKELGLSQSELVTLTKAVNDAFLVSGASTQEMAAAVRQFGQALASGQLRGDELVSVLESAPRLAEAIATGMGVTVGQLRKLGAEGTLASQQVAAAVLASSQQLAAEAAQMPTTIAQGWTVLGNEALRMVGLLDDMTGASRSVGGALAWVADHATDVAAALGGVGAAVGTLVMLYGAYQARLIAVAGYQAVVAAASTISAFISLAKAVRGVGDAMALLQLVGGGAAKAVAGIAAMAAGWFAYKKLTDELDARTKEFNASLDGLSTTAGAATVQVRGLAKEEERALQQMRERVQGNREMVAAAKLEYELIGATTEQRAVATANAEAANKVARASLELKGAELDATKRAIENERVWKVATAGSTAQLERRNAALQVEADVAREAMQRERELAGVREAAAAAPFRNAVENIQREFGDLFSRLFTDGVKAFNDLGDFVRQMFGRLTGEIVSMMVSKRVARAMAGMLGGSLGTGGGGGSNYLSGLGPQMLGQGIGGGVAGGLIGYGIGYSTGSKLSGALGGAAGGALAGAAIGGPIGAVVGGLAGGVAGFLGASQAQKEAAEQLKQAAASFREQHGAFVERAFGSAADQQIAGVRRDADALTAELERLGRSGAISGAEWEKRNKGILDATDELIGRIRQDYTFAVEQSVGSSAARAQRAGGDARRADDTEFALAQARELHEAERQYANSAEGARAIDELKRAQDAERKRREEDRAFADAQFRGDLEARTLAATGHEAEAEALRFRLQQEAELREAQLSGLDAATMAALALAQQAEKARFEAEQALAVQRALGDLDVRMLEATGGDAAGLRFKLQQEREMEDAIRQFGQESEFVRKLEKVLEAERAAFGRGGATGDLATVQDAIRDADAGTALARGTLGGASAQQIDTTNSLLMSANYHLADIARGVRTLTGAGGGPLGAGVGGTYGSYQLDAASIDRTLGTEQRRRRAVVGATRG